MVQVNFSGQASFWQLSCHGGGETIFFVSFVVAITLGRGVAGMFWPIPAPEGNLDHRMYVQDGGFAETLFLIRREINDTVARASGVHSCHMHMVHRMSHISIILTIIVWRKFNVVFPMLFTSLSSSYFSHKSHKSHSQIISLNCWIIPIGFGHTQIEFRLNSDWILQNWGPKSESIFWHFSQQ